VVFGRPLLKDRNEEEIQGYRDALEWIHAHNTDIDPNEITIKKLHKLSRGNIWDESKISSRTTSLTKEVLNLW
jgi:hypothetical protein